MQITDDMVEAGAQAIRVALMRVPPKRDWSQTSEKAREYFRREARACLEAALKVAKVTEVPPHPLLESSGEL